MQPIIELESITKAYTSKINAISEITLKVEKGEIIGLVGPNGSGKTTIIKVLKGLISPTSGTFSIEGISYKHGKNNTELKKLTGFLPENDILLNYLSVNDFLDMISLLYNIPKEIAKERIKTIVGLFNLTNYLNTRISTLSEGTKQRVAWSSALIPNAPIILLDDPLKALDPHSFQLIIELVKKLKDLEKTIILASHYLFLSEQVCERIAFIKDGKIVLEGKIETILEQTNSQDLYEAYLSIFPNPFDLDDIKKLDLYK